MVGNRCNYILKEEIIGRKLYCQPYFVLAQLLDEPQTKWSQIIWTIQAWLENKKMGKQKKNAVIKQTILFKDYENMVVDNPYLHTQQ